MISLRGSSTDGASWRFLRMLLRCRRGDSQVITHSLLCASGVAMVCLSLPSFSDSSSTAACTLQNQVKVLQRGSSESGGSDFVQVSVGPNGVNVGAGGVTASVGPGGVSVGAGGVNVAVGSGGSASFGASTGGVGNVGSGTIVMAGNAPAAPLTLVRPATL